MMRKTILGLSVAAATALSTSAWAQPPNYPADAYTLGAGVVAGTVVGLGFAESWWASPAALNTAVGGVAVGAVAGIGTVALIHSVTTPCTGFRIAFDSLAECARLTGAPVRQAARPARRALR
jgi:hypothetical protein